MLIRLVGLSGALLESGCWVEFVFYENEAPSDAHFVGGDAITGRV